MLYNTDHEDRLLVDKVLEPEKEDNVIVHADDTYFGTAN